MNQPLIGRTLAQITLVSLLILGCLWVLYPFVAAVLFAAVLCTSTWPVFEWLKRSLGQRPTLAAASMTLALALLLLLPLLVLVGQLGHSLGKLIEVLRPWLEHGGLNDLHQAPAWFIDLPLVGDSIDAYWGKLVASQTELLKALQLGVEPMRAFLLKTGSLLANGVIQLSLVLLIAFFFYRDGTTLLHYLRSAVDKLGGEVGQELLILANNTVNGVMNGIVGTALAQAVVMFIGLLIADIPGAVLLSFATFFLSLAPVGPPLIWGGAAIWLYSEGSMGWAIFLALYGVLVVSGVDNFLKPMLISRSASLPILLIALGVFGGMLAFGFIGIFLGPTLLALTYVLFQRWVDSHNSTIV
jgi:predicted PurR-regulated permease PerM